MEAPKAKPPSARPSQSGIHSEIISFVHNIDALQYSLPALSIMSLSLQIASERSLGAFLLHFL